MRRSIVDVDEDLVQVENALAAPCTMEQLTALIGVNRGTIYRRFRDLRKKGVKINRIGLERPTRYLIVR